MAALGSLSVRTLPVGGPVADGVTDTPRDWLQGRSHVVLLVHGFNVTQTAAVSGYGQFTGALAEVGHVFWPGDARGGFFISTASYPWDVTSARDSADRLTDFLSTLFGPGGGPSEISFVGHSLGCRLILDALARIADEGLPAPQVRLLAMMAPAVPVDLLEASQSLAPGPTLAQTVQVLHSTDDRVLHYTFAPGQSAAYLMGIEDGDYVEAVGRYGNPPDLNANRFSMSGFDHGDYWPSDLAASIVSQALGAAVAPQMLTRSTPTRSTPPPRTTPVA